MRRELEIHIDPNRPAAEIFLKHQQSAACVIVPQAEIMGSERVVNAHNIYLNAAALRQLGEIYPSNERTRRSTQDLVTMRILAITEKLPEFQRPTITFFRGNPDGETALSQSSGISLGYTSGANMETSENVVKGLFHIDS